MSWRELRVSACGTHHLHGHAPAYEARFDEVLKFHAPGLSPVRRGQRGWHVDVHGQPAYERRFRRTFGYYEGLAAVIADDGWHHIDANGEDAYPQRYDWCGNFQGGRCPVRERGGSYLHLARSGQPAYAERWRYAGDFRDGVGVVQASDGRSTHIDADGRPTHGQWFADLDVFHKGFARARDARGWTHVDREGLPIYRRRFAAVEPFYNGQARVERFDGALEAIDERGQSVIELRGGPSMIAEPYLSKGLLASLALADPPRVLLLRHADREAIPQGDAGVRTPLTALGERRTAMLRAELGRPLDWALSSPLLRCTRTAELLGAHPTLSTLLGAPGAFVVDDQRGGEVFTEHGTPTIVRSQIDGETWGCMCSLEAGARILVDELLTHLRAQGGTGVAISHDAIVMPTIAHFTGERFVGDWLAPLDGVVITTSTIIWRGRMNNLD